MSTTESLNFPLKIGAFLITHTAPLQILPDLLSPYTTPIYAYVQYLSDTLGLGDFQTTLFMLCLWSSFVFMILARIVPAGPVRQMYTLIIGMTMAFLNFGVGAFHALSCVIYGYGMLLLSHTVVAMCGKKNMKTASKIVQAISVFVYVSMFAHLTLVHWYRMTVDYLGWSLDFSLIQMLLTLKIISVQMNYNDGIRVRALREEKKDPEKHMLNLHMHYSIEWIPDPLLYSSFMYFFPVLLSGPVVEFRDYVNWADAVKLPWDLMEALRNLFWGFVNIGIFVGLGPMFPMRNAMLRPYIDTAPLWEIVWHTVLCAFCLRTKYFVSWYFGQANCVIGGFGGVVDPRTNRLEWSGIDQARFWDVELCTSIRDVATNWNANVSRWLRLYAYTRITDWSKNPSGTWKNILGTFIISALWHGLYFGYHWTFFWLAVLSEIHKAFFKKVTRRIFTVEEWSGKKYTARILVWDFFAWILTHLTISHFTVSFQVLAMEPAFAYYRRCYWIGHILMFVAVAVVFTMPPLKMRGAKKEKGTAESKKEL